MRCKDASSLSLSADDGSQSQQCHEDIKHALLCVKHVLLCVISLLTAYKGFFEPLVLPPEFVGGLDGFVAFVAETFVFLRNLVEIPCELGECMTGHVFGGADKVGGGWVQERDKLNFATPTRRCQPQDPASPKITSACSVRGGILPRAFEITSKIA